MTDTLKALTGNLDEPIREIREDNHYCWSLIFSDHRLIIQPNGQIFIIKYAAGDVDMYHQISVHDFKIQYHDYRRRIRQHD